MSRILNYFLCFDFGEAKFWVEWILSQEYASVVKGEVSMDVEENVSAMGGDSRIVAGNEEERRHVGL